MIQPKTCLWFDTQAAEAAQLYTSVIPGGEILSTSRYGEDLPHGVAGQVLTVEFRLGDQQFVALNGGPHFTHSPAASVQVFCEDQAEVDRIWDALIADGGAESQCGWLTDRFGFSWQVIPTRYLELAADPDPEVAGRVTRAMLQMRKLDIAALEAAAAAS